MNPASPIHVVRSRFDQITELRAKGFSWPAIGRDLNMPADTVRISYRRELQRRTSPGYKTATCWVRDHQQEIAALRARGWTWVAIANLIPMSPDSDEAMPSLEMVIMECQSVMATPGPVPQPSLAIPEAVPAPETVSTQSHEPSTVKGQLSAAIAEMVAKQRAEEAKMRQQRERKANRKSVFDVKDDPCISVAELRAEHDKWIAIYRERAHRYKQIPDGDSRADEKLELKRLRDEANDMIQGYQRLIDSRASHRLTNRSKLCVLATAALACGVYVLAEDTPVLPDAITLIGFDRPDSIPGLTEIPDPVIIRPNLTQDEIERREVAYRTDMEAGIEVPPLASAKRQLAEALILRGAYEFRHSGWVRYDDIVVLAGIDMPSSTLSGYPVSRTEITLAPPLSPSDPVKADYPTEHQRDLIRQQYKGDWL
jgi:hypothetical protein